jgi:HlyD family secretion protein
MANRKHRHLVSFQIEHAMAVRTRADGLRNTAPVGRIRLTRIEIFDSSQGVASRLRHNDLLALKALNRRHEMPKSLIVSPKKIGLALAALGAAFHLVRVGLVLLGRAQPHTLGSFSFPQTAAIIITGTAIVGFVVGTFAGFIWNRLAKLSVKARLSWATVILLALSVFGLGIWNVRFSPVAVQVARLESNVTVQVFGLGTVEARITSQVGFKVSGVLVDLRADVGDCVSKGAVLARLDDREQQAQLARAKALVEQTEASVQRASASVDKAQANYTNAKNINERRQTLVKSNIASVETAETSKALQDAALGELNLAKGDVLVTKANTSDAKAQLQLQGTTLEFHTLVAPYDAKVTARLKELGSALSAGQPVFTLIDPQTIWVLAYIDESKAGGIKVGERADIILRSHHNERLPGRVVRIEPESDRVNEERKVEVAFDHIPADVNLGEQAEAYITTTHLPEALLVPEAAIIGLSNNNGTIWTLEDGYLQQYKVTLGHRLLDGRYEIIGGVPNDASVVTQLRSGLSVGRAATISNEPKR